jgi:hypothetical protein
MPRKKTAAEDAALARVLRAAQATSPEGDAMGPELCAVPLAGPLDPRRYVVYATMRRRDGRPLTAVDLQAIEAAYPQSVSKRKTTSKRAAARTGRG